jgi:hypothetical protein
MATTVSAVVAPPAISAFTAVTESSTFDERWAAWQARGAAHERAVRRRMAIAAPVVLVIVAVVYAFLGR